MLAICSESLKGYGLNRIFEIVKEAGYDGVDLNVDLRNFDTQNAKYVKKLIEQHQLPVLAISAPSVSSAKKITEIVALAKKIDTKIIVIQPPKIFDFKYISWLKNEIPNIRQHENISIALENGPNQTFLGIIPEHAMNNLIDLKKFKHVTIDTTRIATKKEDLIRVYKILKKFLVHVHLSNVKGGERYAPPAKGILPIESFLTKLKQDGYPGTISLKIAPTFLPLGDDDKLMDFLAEQKDFYDTYFTKIQTVHGKENNAD